MTDTATTDDKPQISGVDIVLENVTKTYPGSKTPAVDDVSLEIPAGELVVLVGPSGGGKTTTMRMINRLIEPTSGTITIGGRDALSIDPDKLRRGIGYSIQQAGLFPHMTVAKNIAPVPGLLGWDKARIRARTEEMLDLVGLDPGVYAGRYPRQLSGGEQQRVGVARALAADPPVLLMDEPFGAVDPITRGLLQDELMHLQEELRKTIVFVTHDFNEAVKLGDRIAVLGPRSTIMQYDTPSAILAAPANETVEGFVGSGAALKQLTLDRVRDVKLGTRPTVAITDSVESVRTLLAGRKNPWVIVLDERRRPVSWVSTRDLAHASSLRGVGVPIGEVVSRQSTLQDALEALLEEGSATAVVTGRRGEYEGVVTIDTLVRHLAAMRAEYADEDDTGEVPRVGDTGRSPENGEAAP
ncbi:ATP-binding cassette domain-containing protein [Rhodococcus sp. HNM0569]|uniref:ATP-binding cassette domain-containing protein n=1 Tax=Rhodococcus sp. HNM0569 TaxID=2716340 RepID=UPI00146AB5D1|nr:ATP-binding cassette domain-containing protein [Rhodococcus sp. HNM0569]